MQISKLMGHVVTYRVLQVVQEAQNWCFSVSGGTEMPAFLSLADAALSQFVASLQVITAAVAQNGCCTCTLTVKVHMYKHELLVSA